MGALYCFMEGAVVSFNVSTLSSMTQYTQTSSSSLPPAQATQNLKSVVLLDNKFYCHIKQIGRN